MKIFVGNEDQDMMEYALILAWSFPVLIVIILCFVAFIFATSESIPTVKVFESEKTFKSSDSGDLEVFPSIDDEATVDLSVIVPAYNEEQRLPKMLEECTNYLEKRKLYYFGLSCFGFILKI